MEHNSEAGISPTSISREAEIKFPSRQHAMPLDRRQYAEAIDGFSKLEITHSLYAGTHFETLARYIRLPFEAQSPERSAIQQANQRQELFKFATIRDLNPSLDNTSPQRVQHFHDTASFQSTAENLTKMSKHGHIIFMRGHPSPDWLLTIGKIYQVDPEFFRRHLDFRPERRDFYSLPSLPSASNSMARFSIVTLGSIPLPHDWSDKQPYLRELREDNRKTLETYRNAVKEPFCSNTGDSILRNSSIHDARNFSIEQEISVYVCKTRYSWAGFIWLDLGSDLSCGLTSSFTSPIRGQNVIGKHLTPSYIPTIQHRRAIALKPRSRLLAPLHKDDRARVRVPQTASLLHLDYGRRLDPEVAAADSFYALHEIFCFAAFSEVQFLNMLQSVLAKELSQPSLMQQANPTLANLLYQQETINRHCQQIRDTITVIRNRNNTVWFRGALSTKQQAIANTAAEMIIGDFEYLLMRCQNILEQCDRGIQVVTHNASIKESREAISQAQEVAKLTQLAFIFIPLSFVTSFFGMNLRQFGSGSLEIWLFFVVSLPIFGLCLLLTKHSPMGGRKLGQKILRFVCWR